LKHFSESILDFL